jgi:hypothetical protein
MPQNRIIGIIGPKGSGKTYRAARLFGSSNTAVLYDVAHDEEYLPRATHVTNALQHVLRTVEREEEFRVVYQVNDSDIIPRGKELVYTTCVPLVQSCYERGNMTVFLDEAHELCTQWSIDWQLRKIVRLSRHTSMNIVWVSQSVNEIHRDLRRNTDEFHFFKVHEPADLDRIAERCGDVTADRVANLKRLTTTGGKVSPGECLIWTVEDSSR